MARTRTGVFAGAVVCLAKWGPRKTTMSDVASAAGVAKATLYNHFRTKDELYRALACAEVASVFDVLEAESSQGADAGLAAAARHVHEHPVVRRLAEQDRDVLGALAVRSVASEQGWALAESRTAEWLGARGLRSSADAVSLVVRWLSSHLWCPPGGALRVEAEGLLAALARPSSAPAESDVPAEPDAAAGSDRA